MGIESGWPKDDSGEDFIYIDWDKVGKESQSDCVADLKSKGIPKQDAQKICGYFHGNPVLKSKAAKCGENVHSYSPHGDGFGATKAAARRLALDDYSESLVDCLARLVKWAASLECPTEECPNKTIGVATLKVVTKETKWQANNARFHAYIEGKLELKVYCSGDQPAVRVKVGGHWVGPE